MKKLGIREIITLIIILSLVIFALVYPYYFAYKFNDVVTVVIAYYFVSKQVKKECISPYMISKGENRIRGASSL
jgi:hypothetical protein